MDRRQVFGWVGILLCLGVPIVYALTANFSDTVWQVTTLKADNYYLGAVDITGGMTTTLAYPEQPYSYTIWVDGATYYAKNGVTGAVTNNANFATLINGILTTYGDIYLKAGTYSYSTPLLYTTNTIIRGAARGQSVLYYTGTDPYAVAPVDASNKTHVSIIDLSVVVTQQDTGGINFSTVSFGTLENLDIANTAGGVLSIQPNRVGILLDGTISCYFTQIRNCDIEVWYIGVQHDNSPNVSTIYGGRIRNNFIGYNVNTGMSYDVYNVDFEGNTYAYRLGSANLYGSIYGGYFEYNTYDVFSWNAAPGSIIQLYGLNPGALIIGTNTYDRVYSYGRGEASVSSLIVNGTSVQSLILSMIAGYNANATPPTPPTTPTTPGLPHYTVKYSAPNYITTSDAGANLYTGISATTAIQTGLNSVTAGKMLDIQGGITYPITSQLTLTKNGVYIHANASAVLQFGAAVTGYCFLYSGTSSTHYSDSIIDGLTFDCNHNSYGLRVKWCDNVTMTECTIQNTVHSSYSDGVDWGGDAASPCSVATVTNCTLNGIYYSGLSFSYITDIVVQNSTLNGFCQVYPSGGGIHTDDGCSNVLISSNSLTSTGCLNDGIYVGTTRSFITGCTVTNNTIDLTGPGSTPGYGGAGIKAYAIGATITDNTIDWDDVANEYGVSLWGQANTVTGNIISNCPWGIASWSGYYSSAQHIIQYNDISSCTIGIKLENNDSTANHSIFAGNGTDMVNTGTGNTVTPNP